MIIAKREATHHSSLIAQHSSLSTLFSWNFVEHPLPISIFINNYLTIRVIDRILMSREMMIAKSSMQIAANVAGHRHSSPLSNESKLCRRNPARYANHARPGGPARHERW